jgi:hypothetical protein
MKEKLKKLIRNEVFWFGIFLISAMTYAYIRSNYFYDIILKDTKYQRPRHQGV